MRKLIAIAVLLCVLTPKAFAKEPRHLQPRFDYGQTFKRVVVILQSVIDDILTPPKP
jgi:hypothetical protein